MRKLRSKNPPSSYAKRNLRLKNFKLNNVWFLTNTIINTRFTFNEINTLFHMAIRKPGYFPGLIEAFVISKHFIPLQIREHCLFNLLDEVFELNPNKLELHLKFYIERCSWNVVGSLKQFRTQYFMIVCCT